MLRQVLSAATLTLALASAAHAAPVTISAVTGSGTFNNSVNLLTDGDFALGTWWTDAPNVYWTNQEGAGGVALTFTFDKTYHVTDATIGVDNNDFYVVQTSTNGSSWHTLFVSLPTYIDPDYEYAGKSMIKRSSVLGDASYSNLIDFSPVDAKYARIFALTGDQAYAVSEAQFFGTAAPVPLPASVLLLAPALAALGLRRRQG